MPAGGGVPGAVPVPGGGTLGEPVGKGGVLVGGLGGGTTVGPAGPEVGVIVMTVEPPPGSDTVTVCTGNEVTVIVAAAGQVVT